MRKPHSILAALVLLSIGSTAHTAPLTYFEDFTTSTTRDSVATSAWWNTSSGTLQLFPFLSSVAGTAPSASALTATAVDGDIVYASGQPGQVFDITVPSNPILTASLPNLGDARDLIVDGDYVFVADGASGFTVIQVLNPAAPLRLSTVATAGIATGLDVVANRAYVAVGSAGIQVYNITNRGNPAPLGSFNTAGNANNVSVDGDLAVVADGPGGLVVLNINNSSAVSLVSTMAMTGNANDVVVDGDLAYVAAAGSGLLVVDLSNPAVPVVVGGAATNASALRVQVEGDDVLVSEGLGGWQLFDVTDPTLPIEASAYDSPGTAQGASYFGDYAIVADGASGLVVWQHATRSSAPSVLNELSIVNSFGKRPFVVDGNRLYAITSSRAYIYDVTDPVSPTLLGIYTSPVAGGVSTVDVSGDLMAAYVPTGGGANSGVQLVDVSDPTNPTFLGLFFETGSAAALHFVGNYLYVLRDSAFALQILDISNPAAPVLAGSVSLSQKPDFLRLHGDRAYLGTSQSNWSATVVLNIENPASPVQLTSNGTGPGGLTVYGDWLLTVDFPNLFTYDISNPSVLNFANSLPLTGFQSAFGLQSAGDELFLSSFFDLRVFDISDPTSPLILGNQTAAAGASLELAGTLAFTDTGDKIRTIRIRNRNLLVEFNQAVSVDIHNDPRNIALARLTSTQADAVAWELSANGGLTWQSFLPNDPWKRLTVVGNDLRWRATLSEAQVGVTPNVSDLTIEALLEIPTIDAVEDVRNDNGKQVRVRWTRSGNDTSLSPTPITEYAIFRQIVGVPGSYDYLRSVPATTDDSYAAVVATLSDSTSAGGTLPSTFLVRARTAFPSVSFDSDPLSGYSVDNLIPTAPSGLGAAPLAGGGIALHWNPATESDFDHYRVYRFEGDEFQFVQSTQEATWTDAQTAAGTQRYRVTVVDRAGNESPPAEVSAAIETPPARIPETLTLGATYPNPFNPSVSIPFGLPAQGRVLVRIFDAAGRRVAILVDGVQGAGPHVSTWHGTDDSGRAMGSGVYFYRVDFANQSRSGRMVLVR